MDKSYANVNVDYVSQEELDHYIRLARKLQAEKVLDVYDLFKSIVVKFFKKLTRRDGGAAQPA